MVATMHSAAVDTISILHTQTSISPCSHEYLMKKNLVATSLTKLNAAEEESLSPKCSH